MPYVRIGHMGDYFCAQKDRDGKLYYPVILFVVQPYGENNPVYIKATDGKIYRMKGRRLVIKASPGKHKITIGIGDKRFVRIFNVYKCEPRPRRKR